MRDHDWWSSRSDKRGKGFCMCGICGFFKNKNKTEVSKAKINAMCSALKRRGPDGEGVYVDQDIGLGHRRLKVIDLTTGGQPMSDTSGRYVIVFNGEIYNYRDLKQDLCAKGYVLRSSSDTEVLLYGLIEHGVDFLKRVNGMFAFALWDKRERQLTLARDRFGVKPLYYAILPGNGIAFGSELSAVLVSCSNHWQINQKALGLYLGLSYIPGRDSIMEGIQRLPPGQVLSVRYEGSPILSTWWDLASIWKAKALSGGFDSRTPDEFLHLLDDAVKSRLVSDVPLGAFLSGGIDSSTIVGLMRRHASELKTFTVAFEEASYDESSLARESAQYFGSTHYEDRVNTSDPELLIKIVNELDEPFADTSLLPTYALCGAARKHVTVALSGDGGDELLAGYITLHADSLYPYVRRMPRFIVSLLKTAVSLIPDNQKKVNFVFKVKQFLAAYPLLPSDAHAWWRMLLTSQQMQDLLCQADVPDLFAPFRAAWSEVDGLPDLERCLYVDYKTWLVDDILFKVDRASMNHGLEVRSPFLDYRLVEFCAGLSWDWKRSGSVGKVLLRKVAREILPHEVLTRKKSGFNAPVSVWLDTVWRDLCNATFTKEQITKAGLSSKYVTRLWEEHRSKRADHGYRLFSILVYLLWIKKTFNAYNS
jgi:asparagine synthase (glutamine-hydrolysing)